MKEFEGISNLPGDAPWYLKGISIFMSDAQKKNVAIGSKT
jgi:hypothetical protein